MGAVTQTAAVIEKAPDVFQWPDVTHGRPAGQRTAVMWLHVENKSVLAVFAFIFHIMTASRDRKKGKSGGQVEDKITQVTLWLCCKNTRTFFLINHVIRLKYSHDASCICLSEWDAMHLLLKYIS